MKIEYDYIKNISDDELYSSYTNSLDEFESQLILSEMAFRKHPKTSELCLAIINSKMVFERNEKSFNYTNFALSNLYAFDKHQAIDFFKEHYTELPLDVFGGFIDNYTDVYYNNEKRINN